MRYLIKDIYKDEQSILEWKLRSIKGNNLEIKLNRYLIEKDPSFIVKDLFLDSKEHTQKCFSYLKFGYFYYPSNEDEDERIIKKILWKFGLNQMSYPKNQITFWARYKKFKEVASSVFARSENDKEIIRSEAVNFFVSLEEVLENTLAFTSWILFSDHFSKTRFCYSYLDGLDVMVKQLNGSIFGDNERLELNNKGKNTLFPLITGFGILAKLCEKVTLEKDKYIKPSEELPHYSRNSELVEFPFKYNIHVLNMNSEDIQDIIRLLKDTTSVLERNQVSSIRNRIKHNRVDFPSVEEIVSCCDSIYDIINKFEVYGLYPSISNFKSKSLDQYNRKVSTYLDYRGRECKVINSGQYTPFTLPNDVQFLIIVPSVHIGSSAECIRFRIVEASPYVEVWKGHPGKRF